MKGFTLIELMAVLLIAGILMAFGVPAMTEMVKNNRLSSESNRFAASIRFARSEAIKRNEVVRLSRNSTTNKTWEDGWQIYVDTTGDTNKAIDTPGGDILLRQEAAADGDVLVRSGANGNSWLSYKADGSLDEAGEAVFYLCDSRGYEKGKAVKVSKTGRVNTGGITVGTSCNP